jgi:predicted Zn-dependent peptidase
MKRLFVIFAAVGFAQAPDASFKGVVRLNRAPVSNESLKVKLPRPVERTLANGLKVLVLESHRAPLITMIIQAPSSDLLDPPDLPGVADATGSMIRLGTKTRSSRDIAEALADLGATLNLNTGTTNTTITLSCLTESFDAALAIVSDILLNPSFPQDELDKWKDRQRAALEQLKSNPQGLANERLFKVLYASDARQNTRPTVDSLAKITREHLLEHYRRYYVPAGQIAGIAGDITPRDAAAKLEKALGAWKGGPVERVSLPLNPPVDVKRVVLVSRPASVQTLLIVANRAIGRTDPDYIAAQVMNQVLGSGPASRLFRIIREEKGYTYGINSSFNATRLLNHFQMTTNVRTEVTEPALVDILQEFRDIRERAVPADELAGAKRAIVAGFALALENPANVLTRWLTQREYGLPEDYWDTYGEKVTAITAADVQRVARKYVPLDNAQIIAVGDASKVGELLKKFGPVETVAADAN